MTVSQPCCVQYARERGLESPANKYLSLKSMSGSEDGLDRSESCAGSTAGDSRPAGQRSNSSVHVCWHRATSVAIIDHQRALENQEQYQTSIARGIVKFFVFSILNLFMRLLPCQDVDGLHPSCPAIC